jgi:hypothetical protein
MTPQPTLRRAWIGAITLTVALLVSACTAAGTSDLPPPLGASPSATAGETVAAPTAEPTPSIAPSPSAIASDPTMPEPPAASLAVDGGDPVVGALGSFTWAGGGSDSPWLPGNPIRVGNGERFTLTLADPIGIDTWTASYVPAADVQSATSVGLAEGTGAPVLFEVPPPGRWSVYVSVRFSDGLGSAAYFWLVDVE